MDKDNIDSFKKQLNYALEQFEELEALPSHADKRKIVNTLYDAMLIVENV